MNYRNVYKIVLWVTLPELEQQLNTFSAEGWIADSHCRYDQGGGGWTIWRKTEMLNFLDQSVPVERLGHVLRTILAPRFSPIVCQEIERQFYGELKSILP